jgi:hypothetical protein
MWERYLLVSLVVMCVSYTITQEELFRPLRERAGGKETWLGYLITCPYCASHWLAFILVPVFGVWLLRVPYDWGLAATVIEWFANSILVVILAAFVRLFFYTTDEYVGVLMKQQKRHESAARAFDKQAEASGKAGAAGAAAPASAAGPAPLGSDDLGLAAI